MADNLGPDLDQLLPQRGQRTSCGSTDFSFWLQADIQSPEIDFRSTPNNGHSEAHAGLPVLTQSGHGAR